MNIGRNDLCPCGSGKKYKRCCYGKSETEIMASVFKKRYKEAHRKSLFKECLHPDKANCSERIIKAHTIQKNKILSRIAENGIVLMPCPKPDLSFKLMNEYGLANATIFTGFCSFHDKTTFQSIEDKPFEGTDKQIFLYTYRAFAHEYYSKRVASSSVKEFSDSTYYEDCTINGKNGYELSTMDYEYEKEIFCKALLSHDYDVLTSIVWVFEGESHFAATGGEAPAYDANLKFIQDLSNPDICVRHIYYSAFSEDGKTYFLISWLKGFNEIFKAHFEKLLSLSLQERKNYVNNTLAVSTENVAIRPSSWNSMSEEQKNAYGMLFSGLIEISEAMGHPYDRLQEPGFDLFSI